ncbi:MAG: DNA-binding protein [Desulfuromonadaceae bacterium]|nr:DNA-binding protein [Desulfuromonadaceae bacterium]
MLTTGRFFSIIFLAIILNCLLTGAVFAGFWDSADMGKSGLDFNSGYDVNTVSTMSGRALSLPHPGEKENVFVEIRNGNQISNVYVGQRTYWEKKGIAINPNDELIVKGSKAQGKDGKSYVLAQKVVNRTTGGQVELRNEKGEPVWSGRSINGIRSDSPSGGMMRSGGGMMRSGGGMMRR